MHLQMAKRRITDIARERGLDPNEVASRLAEAGVAIRGDTVDEAAAARALAGSRPVARSAPETATARPAARVAVPPPSHPQAMRPPTPEPRPRQPENRPPRAGQRPDGNAPRPPRDGNARSGPRPDGLGQRAARPDGLGPRAPRPDGLGQRAARPDGLGPRAPRPGDGPGRPRSFDNGAPRPPIPGGGGGGGGGGPAGRHRPQRGVPQGKRRRVVIDSQAARPPREKQQRQGRSERVERAPAPRPTGPVTVPSGVTVKDLAEKLGISAAEIIKMMFALGDPVTITQILSDEAVELIGAELGREITIQRAEDEVEEVEFDDAPEDLSTRAPVVTIMGHVDHGKTTLLDAIRETSVVSTEAGGITQHIGAYQVKLGDRRVTFLDTPGHEAFTALRARGAKVTDVAVLVVAADDGVMPQTIEAMNHAKAAEVPIVVAVNKIDKEDANPTRVRQELVAHGLQPEEWGGQTVFVDVSAKQHQGLDNLLEMLLLQADVLELKANSKAEASGPIIESRLDQGRGPVATMLVQRGTLHPGDAIVAGDAWGKVRAMLDENGDRVKEAGPATPVEILGFDRPPPAGEVARVVDSDRTARQLAQRRAARLRAESLARRSKSVSLEDLFERMQEGGLQELNMVIKGDVQGSVEAAVSELEKLKHDEVAVRVILTGVGAITESDVMLAAASHAIVVGFNVRPNTEARALAEREGVDVRTYRVIYQLTEDIEQALVGMLRPQSVEEVLGEAEVRQLFRVSRLGTIAGCMVTHGVIQRNAKIRVIRDGTVVWDGTIDTLRRVKDDVREVAAGFECGILLHGFNDVHEGDVLEAYTERLVERTEL
jgi:translation initiation factor IF-2